MLTPTSVPSAHLEGRLVGAGSLCCLQTGRVHHVLDEQLHLEGDDCSLHLSTLSATGVGGIGGARQTCRMECMSRRTACHESRYVVVAKVV